MLTILPSQFKNITAVMRAGYTMQTAQTMKKIALMQKIGKITFAFVQRLFLYNLNDVIVVHHMAEADSLRTVFHARTLPMVTIHHTTAHRLQLCSTHI